MLINSVYFKSEANNASNTSCGSCYFFLAHVLLRENWNLLFQFLSLSFFRQLCLLLNAEDIYRALSEIIVQEEDLLFASLMVRYLNMILLTSSELFDLRDQLRELATPVSNS